MYLVYAPKCSLNVSLEMSSDMDNLLSHTIFLHTIQQSSSLYFKYLFSAIALFPKNLQMSKANNFWTSFFFWQYHIRCMSVCWHVSTANNMKKTTTQNLITFVNKSFHAANEHKCRIPPDNLKI